ncbi:MAG: hypothetical protein KDB03_13830 [Planctomycetales bacterium]|nr:hypothetical protein [Planctomycetales bacterium]
MLCSTEGVGQVSVIDEREYFEDDASPSLDIIRETNVKRRRGEHHRFELSGLLAWSNE